MMLKYVVLKIEDLLYNIRNIKKGKFAPCELTVMEDLKVHFKGRRGSQLGGYCSSLGKSL